MESLGRKKKITKQNLTAMSYRTYTVEYSSPINWESIWAPHDGKHNELTPVKPLKSVEQQLWENWKRREQVRNDPKTAERSEEVRRMIQGWKEARERCLTGAV